MLQSRYAEKSPEDTSNTTPKRKASIDEKPLPPVPGLGASRYAGADDDSKSATSTPTKSRSREQNIIAPAGGEKTPVMRSPEARKRDSRRTSSLQLDHAKSQSTELQSALGINSPSKNGAQPLENGTASTGDEAVTPITATEKETQPVATPALNGDTLPKASVPAAPAALAPSKPQTPDILRAGTPAGGRIVRKSKRGKAVVIRVPPGEAHKRTNWMPLSVDEVKARLDAFERDGFDTRGFGYWRGGNDAQQEVDDGQVVPDKVASLVKETATEKPQVTIPDRKKWEAYMDDMMEQKLRSLGVATADEEPPLPPPSRTDSARYPQLAMSPPIPSSSTASQQMFQNSLPFSAPFSPGTSTNDTSLGAIASPALSLNQQLRPGHLSRQSTFGIPNVPTPSSSYTQPAQQPMWSPQPSMAQQQSFFGAGQPYHFPSGTPDFFADRQQTPRAFEAQQGPIQLSNSPNPSLPHVEEDEANEDNNKRPATPPQARNNEQYAELAYPTPRGHRHNISAQLEKEAENPQYYPGEYVDQNRPSDEDEDAQGPHFSFSNAANSSASPSVFDKPRASGHQPTLSTASNASASKLNVQAKEFKFNPQGFHGKGFSIPKAAFLPETSGVPRDLSKPTVSYITAHGGGGSTGDADFNAQAKSFQPGSLGFAFKSNAFNFAAEKEKASQPSKEVTPEPPPSGSRIFGGLNMSDIIKPAKKSKAIPIVNPNDIETKTDDDDGLMEDADGRPAQEPSRIKRGRMTADDGDDVPMFAEPTPEPPVLKSNAPVPDAIAQQTASVQESNAIAEEKSASETVVPESTDQTPTVEAPKAKDLPKASTPAQENPVQEPPMQALPKSEPPKPEPEQSQKDVIATNDDTVDDNSDVPWHDFGIESLREQSRRRDVDRSDVIRSISPPLKRASDPASRTPQRRESQLVSFEETPTPGEPEISASSSAETEELRRQERFQKATPEPSMQELNDIMDHINRHEAEDQAADDAQNESMSKEQARYVPPHLRDSKGDVAAEAAAALKSIREPSPPPVMRPVSPPSDLLSGDMHDIKNPGLSSHLSLKPSKAEVKRNSRSPVRRLNNLREPAVSDWDDTFSPTEDFKLLPRPQQSDAQMKLLFEGLLRTHLEPLQRSIRDLNEKQASGKDVSTSRPVSSQEHEKSSSDADDEDDESDASPSKRRTSKADLKNEKLRVAVIDAIKSTQSHGLSQAVEQMRLRNEAETKSAELQRLLTISEKEIELYKESNTNFENRIRDLEGDRRDLLQQITAADKADSEMKKIQSDLEVELAKKEKFINEYRSSSSQWQEACENTKRASEDLVTKIDQLKRDSADQQLARESLEHRLSNIEKSLAEAEETLKTERVEFQEAKVELSRKHVEALEELEETLKHERATSQVATDELNRKHEQALVEVEDNLKNERVTWQAANEELNRRLAQNLTETDETMMNERGLWHKERDEINRKHVQALTEAEGVMKAELETKLVALEKSLAEADARIKNERVTWQATSEEQTRKHAKAVADIEDALRTERANSQQWEEEQSRKLESVKIRLDETVKQRNLAEKEIVRLGAQERELIKRNVILEEVQNSNTRLQNELEQVRGEAIRHQRAATHHQHEAAETRRDIEAEVRRAKNSLEAEIEIANRKVESMRAELDTRMGFMKSELENTRTNAASTKKRLEKELEFSQNSRQEALQTISQASNASLKEERQKFERSLKEITVQHDRTLKVAIEDKERMESTLREKLDVSQTKHELLEDKIKHLEDRVAVAQAAAKSAAESARSAAARGPVATSAASPVPERISPQALRESIAVLQEQLQERETRIESLESQLTKSTADETKLRERDTEVSWLRELLNVRVDDLADLVKTLSQDEYDPETARNAAIRIQANLQMERQEKDRSGRGGPGRRQPPTGLPSLQDFQNFASPKAAQLHAAWSSWRKGKDSTSASNLREAMNSTPSRAVSSSVIAEGSSSAQSFLSGLMTPPASNLRRSPSFEKPPPPLTLAPDAATATSPPQRGNKSSRRSTYALPARDRTPEARPGSRESLQPKTPPLLRKGSYDLDAAMAEPSIEDNDIDDEEEEAEPSAAKTVESTELEPLGEVIANE